jgi:hypothetical protein
MATAHLAESVLAHWAQWWRRVGFLLRGLLQHLAKQFMAAPQKFLFQMAQTFLGGANRVMKPSSQAQQYLLPLGGQEHFQFVGVHLRFNCHVD